MPKTALKMRNIHLSHRRAYLQRTEWNVGDTGGTVVISTAPDRQTALDGLVKAVREFRKFTDEPLAL